MTGCIRAGLRAAARQPKLTFLLWAWYGLLALVPAFPVWRWWNQALGASPEGAAVLKRFDLGVFLDLTRAEGAGGLGLMSAAVVAAGGIALVSSAFAFGGILEVLGTAGDPRSFMHRFFRGGGHFFWRFFRLAIIAGVCVLLLTGVVSALMAALTNPLAESEWEPGFYLGSAATVGVVLVTVALFLLALDYTRIRVARDDSRRMLKAYVSGLGFVLRRLPSVYGIAIAFLAVETALVVLYLAYETNAPAAGTWPAIAALVLLQQLVVVGRVSIRVAMAASERCYFEAWCQQAVTPGALAVPVPNRGDAPAASDPGPMAQATPQAAPGGDETPT